MKPKMHFEFHAWVDFLEVFQASDLRERDGDAWDAAMARVRKLKYVDEAWIDHTCRISISAETANPRIAERRVKDVIAKAARIIRSYKSKP